MGGIQDVARLVPRKNQWEGYTFSYNCTLFLEKRAAGSSAVVWRTINSIMDHFFSVKWIYSTITPFLLLLFFSCFHPKYFVISLCHWNLVTSVAVKDVRKRSLLFWSLIYYWIKNGQGTFAISVFTHRWPRRLKPNRSRKQKTCSSTFFV